MFKNREDLRKYFLKQLDLFIKMRDNEDIVYYKGFKLLTIKGDNSELSFEIDPSTYNFNEKSMTFVYENSSIDKDIENIYVDRRNLMNDYLSLKLNYIIINRANEKSYKNNIEDVKVRINAIVMLLKNEYSNYLNDTNFNVEDILLNLETKGKYVINFNDEKLSNEKLAKLESFVVDNTIFTNKKYDYITGLSKPTFSYKFIVDNKKILSNLEHFIDKRKKSLDDYEKYTGYELEKRYQQDLMIKYRNKKIFPFELEYYTLEKDEECNGKNEECNEIDEECNIKDGDRGRIDCIFVNIDNDKLKDIYMIELKVNEGVIDGTNGVNKHFIDIINLMNDEANLLKFKERLLKRLNLMLKLKNEKDYVYIEEDKNINLHFHTIISFSDDDIGSEEHKVRVERLINRLNKSSEIEKMRNRKSNPIPLVSKTIYEHLVDLNNSNCESFIYYNGKYDPNKGSVSSDFIKKEIKINE